MSKENRISVQEYQVIIKEKKTHILLDVRETVQFNICSLPNSIHIPLALLSKRKNELSLNSTIYVICRLGNDSQLAVEMLKNEGYETVKDIIGGLLAWHNEIDPSFPSY